MKNYIYIFTTIILFTLIFTSCKKEEIIPDFFKTSTKSLEFGTNQSSKKVVIETNIKEWTAKTDAKWISLKKEGSELVVTASKNIDTTKRKTTIIIQTKNHKEIIEVVQKEVTPNLNIAINEIKVGSEKGIYILTVNTNIAQWTAHKEVNWIKLLVKDNNLEISYDINKGSSREAKINIKVGELVKTITIRQKSADYILPFIDFSKDITTIENFEIKRGSLKLSDEEVNTKNRILKFQTKSNLFADFKYFMSHDGNTYKKAVAMIADFNAFDNNLDKIKDFLQSNGFEKQYDKYYVNPKIEVSVLIFKGRDKAGLVYKSEKIEKQSVPQETFSELPVIINLKWGTDTATVNTYETSNSGIKNEEESIKNHYGGHLDMLIYNIEKNDKQKPFKRIYFIFHSSQYKDGLGNKKMYIKDISLAMYKMSNGKYRPTNEFIKLAKVDGYSHSAYPNRLGAYAFENKQQNTLMTINVEKENGQDVLSVFVERLDLIK